MATRYVYDFSAPIRKPGAQGWGDQLTVPVFLDSPQATFDRVTDALREQYPPHEIVFFQPNGVITINGEDTLGCGDREFAAARSFEDDDHARMVRLRAER